MAAPAVRRVIKIPRLTDLEPRPAVAPAAVWRGTSYAPLPASSASGVGTSKGRTAAAVIPASPPPMVFQLEGFEEEGFELEAADNDPVTDSATHMHQAVHRLLTPGPDDTAVSSVPAGGKLLRLLPPPCHWSLQTLPQIPPPDQTTLHMPFASNS